MRLFNHTGRRGLLKALGQGLVLSTAVAVICGCDTKGFLDPTEMGRFQKDPLVMPIVSTVDPALEEPDNRWALATEPTAQDLLPPSGDYRISPNDMLGITLSDLNGPNTETIKQSRVTESGNISLPFLKEPIRAKGLTEIQLEQAIVEAYRQAQLIQNANVSVTVMEARGRAFDVLGAVGAPQTYPILNSDFRLLNALVMAKDVTSPFVTDIYILRQPEEMGNANPMPGPPRRTGTNPTTGPSSDELAPHVQAPGPASPIASTTDHVVHLATATEAGDGQQNFSGFRESNPGAGPRVIHIPYAALKRGELRYNIPIHPHDVIYVDPPEQGFYFVGGHVTRGGSFQLVGQKITLKDAIISANMLDGLAIPQRTDIIRHVAPDHQVFVRVDLARVFEGEQPDIYLKPGDQILVGTNMIAPFLAAIRGGFRMTYGFGFLYDRNYAYPSSLQNP